MLCCLVSSSSVHKFKQLDWWARMMRVVVCRHPLKGPSMINCKASMFMIYLFSLIGLLFPELDESIVLGASQHGGHFSVLTALSAHFYWLWVLFSYHGVCFHISQMSVIIYMSPQHNTSHFYPCTRHHWTFHATNVPSFLLFLPLLASKADNFLLYISLGLFQFFPFEYVLNTYSRLQYCGWRSICLSLSHLSATSSSS